MAARKGIHPSYDDRPCPDNVDISRAWMPERLGFPPLCGTVLDPPGRGPGSVCCTRPPSDKCAGSQPLLPPVEFSRTQTLSYPLLLP